MIALSSPHTPARNQASALHRDWLEQPLNPSLIKQQAHAIASSRNLQGDNRTAWLLKAITCIDLTTLAGDDTPAWVRQLCYQAMHPLPSDLADTLGVHDWNLHTAAVCVYHHFVATAVDALQGTLPVAAVSTGFPAALSPLETKIAEVKASVAAGAAEIDVVITRAHVLLHNWQALFEEILAFREACGQAHLKVILGTGELGSLQAVYQASMVAMLAGADFIKTSTGKEAVNATLPVSLVMLRAIADYQRETGYAVGFKPAGGIRSAEDALQWLILVKEVLGNDWLTPARFRFGASSLLGNLVKALQHDTSPVDMSAY